jgi:hypothetical protein
MIVGVEVGPTLATAAELIGRYDGSTLALRGGFAHGQALIMDGDDYIGRPTNLASRLCQAAHPEELLAVGYPAASLPTWIRVLGIRSVTLPGLGRIRGVQRLGLVPDLELPDLSNHNLPQLPGIATTERPSGSVWDVTSVRPQVLGTDHGYRDELSESRDVPTLDVSPLVCLFPHG